MKKMVLLFTAVCCLFSINAFASDKMMSLNPELEALKTEALSHMSSSIDSSDIGEQIEGQPVQVSAPGIEQVGENSTIKSILIEALEMKSSSDVVDFMDDVNNVYGVLKPVFMAACCGCGNCD